MGKLVVNALDDRGVDAFNADAVDGEPCPVQGGLQDGSGRQAIAVVVVDQGNFRTAGAQQPDALAYLLEELGFAHLTDLWWCE
jgi:hypothetical protein